MKKIEDLRNTNKQDFINYMRDNIVVNEYCDVGYYLRINGTSFNVYLTNGIIVEFSLVFQNEYNKNLLNKYNVKSIEDYNKLNEKDAHELVFNLYNHNAALIEDYCIGEQQEDIIEQLAFNGYDIDI